MTTFVPSWRKTPDKIKEIIWDLAIAKRQSGEGYAQIARSLGISKTTAFRLCNHVQQMSCTQLCELSAIPRARLHAMPEHLDDLRKKNRRLPPDGWLKTLQISALEDKLREERSRH